MIVILVIVGLIVSYQIVKLLVGLGNTVKNSKTKDHIADIVDNQNNERVGALRYGLFSMSYNGCEIIAVHNARILLKQVSTLSDTIRVFNRCRCQWLLGIFGTHSDALARVMKKVDLNFVKEKEIMPSRDGVYIVSFWNGRIPFDGIHTVAVEVKDGKLTIYNSDKISDNIISVYRLS